jgi:hypothetical protein
VARVCLRQRRKKRKPTTERHNAETPWDDENCRRREVRRADSWRLSWHENGQLSSGTKACEREPRGPQLAEWPNPLDMIVQETGSARPEGSRSVPNGGERLVICICPYSS